jgi:hypothetical protein
LITPQLRLHPDALARLNDCRSLAGQGHPEAGLGGLKILHARNLQGEAGTPLDARDVLDRSLQAGRAPGQEPGGQRRLGFQARERDAGQEERHEERQVRSGTPVKAGGKEGQERGPEEE